MTINRHPEHKNPVTLNDPIRHPEFISGSYKPTVQSFIDSRIAPVGISALFASVGSQPRLSYVAYR